MDTVAREFGQRTNIVRIVVIDTNQVVALSQQTILRRVRDTIGTIVLVDLHDAQRTFRHALLRPVQPYSSEMYTAQFLDFCDTDTKWYLGLSFLGPF